MSNLLASGNFFGPGLPERLLELGVDQDNPDEDTRFPVVGDRWINTLTGDNYVYTSNNEWIRVLNNNLNDIPALYNECIETIVTIILANTTNSSASLSSGFFISSDGFFIAPGHSFYQNFQNSSVITFNFWVTVFPENVSVPAIVIGVNSRSDIILGKIDLNDPSLSTPLSPRKFLPILDSKNIPIGSPVITIGTPGIASISDPQNISFGIISNNLSSSISAFTSTPIIASCKTCPGFSGGPLITLNGKAIGLVSSGTTDDTTIYNIYIFAASNGFLPVLNYFINNYLNFGMTNQVWNPGFFGINYIQNSYLQSIVLRGISLSISEPAIVEGLIIPTGTVNTSYLTNIYPISDYGIPNSTFTGLTSAFIPTVFPGSPADLIGLTPGLDIIMTAGLHNGILTPVGTNQDEQNFNSLLNLAGPTGKIDIQYRRKSDIPPYSILHTQTGIGLTGYPSQYFPFFFIKFV